MIVLTLPLVHSNRLMKKGGGIGPTKPWQPANSIRKGAKSNLEYFSRNDKLACIP